MGNLDQIEILEGYIGDLGKELKDIKKASEYLKLIEEFQEEVTKSSSTLSESKNQLKSYQDVVENKLELFIVKSQANEHKMESLGTKQKAISTKLDTLLVSQESNASLLNKYMDAQSLFEKKATKMFYTMLSLIIVLSITIISILFIL